MKWLFAVAGILFFSPLVNAQTKPMEQALYPGKIPNFIEGPDEESSDTTGGILRISKISRPTLTIYLPSPQKANGTAVIICPGGGYAISAAKHEGYDVAKKFNEIGVAAFVLKYRIPNRNKQTDPSIAPLQDAQQAILTVRHNAKKWRINPERVGIMGFSAGGHLASTAGTHFEKSLVDNPDNQSVRPDFMMLIYPVISANFFIKHAGSFKNLLGEYASVATQNQFSNELRVTDKTPPTFLVHASDDEGVKPDNSIVFYQALVKHKIPAELHLYQKGGHGFGLNNRSTKDAWFDRCKNWMDTSGWLKK